MKVTKTGESAKGCPTEEELSAVNAFAKTELTAQEVYCFAVKLCDNEVDRDFERFTEKTLRELSELFVGKTGISDHEWSAERQKARIYRCEVLTDTKRKNSLGMPYTYLKGHAYMLRTEGSAELIAEIEGGIKKETSVGLAVAKTVCSICGEELGVGGCTHVKGRTYAGKLCCGELTGAVDAYEWSFVAVPAQKEAGVLKKSARAGNMEAVRSLYKRAELGDRYLAELRSEVLRLGLICDKGLYPAMEKSVQRMEAEELIVCRDALKRRAAELLPIKTQLPARAKAAAPTGDEYRI